MTSQEFAAGPVADVDDAVPPQEQPVHVESGPEAEAGTLVDVVARLAELTDALVAVQQELRSADQRAAGRERIIDRLHDDNQKLRIGERHLVLLPLLTDLQQLRNELLRQAAAPIAAEQMAKLLYSYAHSIEQTLERGGVTPIRPRPGEPFDGSRHSPFEVVVAPEPAFDGRVAAVVAEGYEEQSGRVLTRASVRVHRWIEPTEENHAR